MVKAMGVKALALLLVLALLLGGCQAESRQTEDKTLRIVTTIFPIYDWVRELTRDRDNVELTLLQDAGVDLHSYQPSTEDMVKIAACDLFIFVGGESDEWAEKALGSGENKKRRVLNLLEILGDAALAEEEKEGMQEEEGHDHDHEHEAEEAAADEHVWLSLKNADLFVEQISLTLKEMDIEHKSLYEKNESSYRQSLKALAEEYAAAAREASTHTLIFADRFPFRYLTEELGQDYFAAFPGCSAETEASFETIIFLVKKLDELNLGYILSTESSDGRMAETIKNSSAAGNQKLLVLDSLQSVTREKISQGASYLSIMRANLTVLREAMGCGR